LTYSVVLTRRILRVWLFFSQLYFQRPVWLAIAG
jgi:hypothetical protein